ncbi:MAG TPA: pantoate--beta-alanine ligase [Chryseosolibacter sp.]|nr:pantoate--beta-alanine ligase [Chryseosolibacter sp.]
MEIFKQIAPLKAFLSDLKCHGKSVGLVPTMGALHDGHISLIKASKAENHITVSSIFVNPIQFNNQHDLVKYPRNIEKDTELLKSVGCDVLFNPENTEMYPKTSVLKLDFGNLDKVMEGQFRQGHFSGVALVVSKLFNIVQPDYAYFGQKDWQQFAIIEKLTEELNFNIGLRSVPTLRESDGLALSSRNERLNAGERALATVFYKGLLQAKTALRAGKSIREVKPQIRAFVEQYPGARLEYFEVADSKNLNLLENVEQSAKPIMCIAGYVGEIRLIDNMFIV